MMSTAVADVKLTLQFDGNAGYTYLRGYLNSDCTGNAYTDGKPSGYLYLGFEAIAGDKSKILFALPQQKLKTGVIGTYTFISPQNTSNDLSSRLEYTPSSANFTTIVTGDYDSSNTTGSFQVTAYNTATKMADGNFRVVLKDVRDPQQTPATPSSQRRIGDVTLTGEFKNLKMPD
ncbi:hypothetical protein AUC43_05320 [Hymenobacter sedentarius]|uniref:Uncharacterized protein n=1 Tax=Hymenobacter sedentarius TaxID=1411621 RepID=A0A0U4BLF7_9BACT|nr:hypothetical protein AUC43_05320 [Hymenobacter sedentarius]